MANLLERWEITIEELTELVDKNPSMRGYLMGYIAEHKMRIQFFGDERIKNARKDDDHDRRKKGDLTFEYRGLEFRGK